MCRTRVAAIVILDSRTACDIEQHLDVAKVLLERSEPTQGVTKGKALVSRVQLVGAENSYHSSEKRFGSQSTIDIHQTLSLAFLSAYGLQSMDHFV